MTKDYIQGTLLDRLNKFRPNVLEQLLSPLRHGHSVTLVVDDIRLPKKTRRYKTVLIISPYTGQDCPTGYLLVAMPPYNAELIDPRVDLKPSVFARLGLSFSLASAIADALTQTLWSKT